MAETGSTQASAEHSSSSRSKSFVTVSPDVAGQNGDIHGGQELGIAQDLLDEVLGSWPSGNNASRGREQPSAFVQRSQKKDNQGDPNDAPQREPIVEHLWSLGRDFSPETFQRHAELVGDNRLSHPANREQRATIMRELQHSYGNRYVQRLVRYKQPGQVKKDGIEIKSWDAFAKGEVFSERHSLHGPNSGMLRPREGQQQIQSLPHPLLNQNAGAVSESRHQPNRRTIQTDRQKTSNKTGSQSSKTNASGLMSRIQFEDIMMKKFGVKKIFSGTFEDQVARVRSGRKSLPSGTLTRKNWRSWDPGSSSPIYQGIIDGFSNFGGRIGGIPRVVEIGFFDTCYELDSNGSRVIAKKKTMATFGGGKLDIYRVGTTSTTPFALPMGRSSTGTPSKTPLVAVSTEGSKPGAPLALPTRKQHMIRLISHELGHGLIEAALTPRSGGPATDPTMINDYRKAVGWTTGRNPALFDIGVKSVQQALQTGATPSTAYRITRKTWNNPKWVEQPLTWYMLDSPAEDFSEAVMAYVNEPTVLSSRSPRRYKFLSKRISTWLPQLLKVQ